MLRRLLVVLGLTGLVVAQPVLDLLGRSPATFDLYGVEGRTILWFAALVVVLPPLVVSGVGEIVRLVDERAGGWLHLATVALLLGGFGVLLAKAVTGNGIVHVLGGLIVGAGGAWLYHRFEGMGLWLRLMAAANLLFFAQFALFAPVADWIESATGTPEILVPEVLDEPDAADPPTADDPATDPADTDPPGLPSIFIVVLDEMPTQTLLTPDGEIDALRYPRFADFATEATWHRHHTTNSPFTHSAVPSLLDGKEPQGGPTWVEHPENLFNLFAASHHLVVSEVLTKMCGFDTCGDAPVPPPPLPDPEPVASGESDADPPPPTTTAAPVVAADDGARWGDLVGATWDVWVERLSPGGADEPRAFDDFQEDFGQAPPPTTSSTTTTTTTTTIAPSDDEPATDAAPTTTVDERSDEDRALAQFFQMLAGAQPERMTEFLAAVRPSDRPLFGYLHLILPHQPWVVREDGTLYELGDDRRDYEADNGSGWPVRVARQRHVLQTQYTDQVIGLFLDHLAEQGLYDDSLIIVVGDHGVSFVPGQLSRSLTTEGLPSITYTPLLIKAPGQTSGAIDDGNLTIRDVPDTVADLLGIGLPWETDGAAAGSPAVAERGSQKAIHDFRDASDYTLPPLIEFDDDEAFARLLADAFTPLEPGADPVSALYAGVPGEGLIGSSATETFTSASGGRVEVTDLDRLTDPGDEVLLGEIAGRLAGRRDATVVVAVNDVVVGVSPLYERGASEGHFVVLLPAGALRADANDIRVGVLEADGTVGELDVAG